MKTEEGNKSMNLDNLEGWELEDGTEITKEWLLKTFKPNLYWTCQNIGGSMNDEDKGLVHQYMVGKMLMMFKQWMVRLYSNRFRKPYYDAFTKDMRGGYYATTAYAIARGAKERRDKRLRKICAKRNLSLDQARWVDRSWSMFAGAFTSLIKTLLIHKSAGLSAKERANVRKFWTEQIMLAALCIGKGLLGVPDDDDNYVERMARYQLNRAWMDGSAMDILTAKAFFSNSVKLIRDPFAVAREAENQVHWIYLTDLWEPVGKRKKRAHFLPGFFNSNLYLYNLYFKVLPFTSDIEKIKTFTENDNAFKIFDSSALSVSMYNK